MGASHNPSGSSVCISQMNHDRATWRHHYYFHFPSEAVDLGGAEIIWPVNQGLLLGWPRFRWGSQQPGGQCICSLNPAKPSVTVTANSLLLEPGSSSTFQLHLCPAHHLSSSLSHLSQHTGLPPGSFSVTYRLPNENHGNRKKQST